ncbi:HYC_CC_PP family protein [Olivibacter domesticus]|uniref:HYC_CC_PP family protein n=1 Tax=Olivibacter domesticus TaxID=407022 RepID=UPI0011145FA9|nr:hypothetical protein [Olivibacter domesticus]
MKKLLLIILTFFYLGVSTGFTMHLHYCMERFVETNLWHGKEEVCGKCGMKKEAGKKKDCCKDEHKQVKLDKLHKGSEIAFLEFQKISIILPTILYPVLDYQVLSTITDESPLNNSPPHGDSNPLYLKNRVFRI